MVKSETLLSIYEAQQQLIRSHKTPIIVAIMGKQNSKLKNDTLEKLTAETYCKYLFFLKVYLYW